MLKKRSHRDLKKTKNLKLQGLPGGGRGVRGDPTTTPKIGLSPTVLTQKWRCCNFCAVFGHFAQIDPPPVDPFWETLM